MEQILIFLVDDDDGNTTLFEEELRFEFERLGISPTFKPFHTVSSALQAVKDATDRGEIIDAALVDLCLTPGSTDPNGVRVVEYVKEHHRDAYRLLCTGFDRDHRGFVRRYEGQVDLAVVRWDIAQNSSLTWRMIAEQIKTHLIDTGRLTAGSTAYDTADVGIMSVLEDVGHDAPTAERGDAGARILKLLALQCLDGRVDPEGGLEIEFLAAGRSGANVCRLVFSGPSQSFVLKFGHDPGGLKRELDKNVEAARVLGHPLMEVVGNLASHRSGYHAIAAKFASNSIGKVVTLRKWLGETASFDEAARAATEVFAEILGPLFSADGIKRIKVDDWLRLRPGRQLRTLESIDRFKGVLSDARACNVTDANQLIERISAFVRGDRAIAAAPSEIVDVVYVRSFGDLHSNNILIQLGVNPRPVLIDASLYGRDHWAADHARLLADLLLRVRNAGVESMLWPAVTGADEQIVLLCRHCQSAESLAKTSDDATSAFIAQTVRQLESSTHMLPLGIPSTSWHWEWHVSLAREFLRQATYEDLTPPRACMALLLADRHLGIARGLPH